MDEENKVNLPPENKEDSAGGDVCENQETAGAAFGEQMQDSSTATAEPMQDKRKRKKLWFIVIAVAALAVAIIAVLFVSRSRKSSVVSDSASPLSIYAEMADDGSAYIPTMSGDVITIQDDVESAVMTPDRKRIVVLLKNGTLYFTDAAQREKNIISESADGIGIQAVRNDGFIYVDEESNYYRVLYSDQSAEDLGKNIIFVTAENNISVLYVADGGVYTLGNNSSESEKVGTYDDAARPEIISDNAELAVWVNVDGKDYQPVVSDKGELSRLETISGKKSTSYPSIYETFSRDQKLLMIHSADSDCLWVKRNGEADIEKINLGSSAADSTIYTQNGELSDTAADKIKAVYIATDGDDGSNIYYVTLDGDRERVLSKVENYAICGGTIFYSNNEGDLYRAKLSGSELKDEEKISSDVEDIHLTANGMYLYYLKDDSLYCCKKDEAEAIKTPLGEDTGYYIFSEDGASVFCFTDVESIPEIYTNRGMLISWTYGEEDVKKIASDVVTISVTSYLDTYEIKKNQFAFCKYDSVDADDNVHVNWMYYNGQETVKMVSDLVYNYFN